MSNEVDDLVDGSRFCQMDGQPGAIPRTVKKWEGFKVGDLVSCYRCEEGRVYMPGVGAIVNIFPDEEYPFQCEHADKFYYYKAAEIVEHDFY